MKIPETPTIQVPEVIPVGYCQCGCGLLAPIATMTNSRQGHVKGQPVRFIKYHYGRARYGPWIERFWSQVDRTTTPDGCWPWIGALDKSGYGQIEVNGRNRRATHIALELVGFSIPWEGLQVRHYICNNRPCCRYSHLKIGTSKDNIEDRDSQGRQARGERVGGAKLNPVKVREIRRLYTAGGTTYEALGQQFGVSEDNIGHIIRGETWRLGPP